MAQKDLSKQQSKDLLTKAGLEAFHPPLRFIQELSIWTRDKSDAISGLVFPSVKIRKLRLEEVISEFGPVRRTECEPTEAIDIVGSSRTGGNGKMTWRLTDFICLIRQPIVEAPASFIATPISQSPVYLTTTIEFPEPPANAAGSRDLIVEVFSWDPGGSSAPRIPFSWRCRVRYKDTSGPVQ